MRQLLSDWIGNRRVLIAGFGREGRSTFEVLGPVLETTQLAIADVNPNALDQPLNQGYQCFSGAAYLERADEFNIIIKSPGIPQNLFAGFKGLLTTQVDIFFKFFAGQCIGITGTKGKSTTASLVHHLIQSSGRDSVLVGNIGIPIFSVIDRIKEDTIIVCELSAHQLENTLHVPFTSAILNFFPEHLDHFSSYEAYKSAKARIALLQEDGAQVIIPYGDEDVFRHLDGLKSECIQVSIAGEHESNTVIHDGYYWLKRKEQDNKLLRVDFQTNLKGEHNKQNALIASVIAKLHGLSTAEIESGLSSFQPLPHRIEPVGVHAGIMFYNDSIATVPQATLAAMKALGRVDTLILGGFDRGLDYKLLYESLFESDLSCLILIGAAGKRMCTEMPNAIKELLRVECLTNMAEAVGKAAQLTPKGGVCLLSPAAASYDQYSGFEERGEDFKRLVNSL